jgi:hypothetical protein
MQAVVYTAIFGGHDTLKEPVLQDEPCDFICFTDAWMPFRVGAWRVIHVRRDPKLYARVQARRFKLLSHRVLPGGRLALRYSLFSLRHRADLSIWVDGSLRIKSSSFVADMRARLGGNDWAMFIHPDRDCIYDEARVCATLMKCNGQPIFPQVDGYKPIVPPHGGLYASTIIVRREPASERILRANELWFEEILKWTNRDQLSLPYVLRKLGGSDPAYITEPLRSNKWFDIVRHNRDT